MLTNPRGASSRFDFSDFFIIYFPLPSRDDLAVPVCDCPLARASLLGLTDIIIKKSMVIRNGRFSEVMVVEETEIFSICCTISAIVRS